MLVGHLQSCLCKLCAVCSLLVKVAGRISAAGASGDAEPAFVPAGFGWQIGWYFEIAWQLFFVQDTAETMWVSMFLLLGAFLGFAVTLLSLYR